MNRINKIDKYRLNYKTKSTNTNTRETRKANMEMTRKNLRYDMHNLNRNIIDNGIVEKTIPNVINSKVKSGVVRSKKQVAENCKSDLTTKAKPVFKVCHVRPEELYNLENAYNYIKGRPIKSTFAPANHQFKPPKNMNPIMISNNIPKPTVKRDYFIENVTKNVLKSPKKKTITHLPKYQYNLRSRNKNIDKKTPNLKRGKQQQRQDDLIKKKENSNDNTNDKDVLNETFTINSIKPPTPRKTNLIPEPDQVDDTNEIIIASEIDKNADYFLNKLNTEITRINTMCCRWNEDFHQEDLPENAHRAISVTIGQSQLLISKKFQQFRKLIDEYRLPIDKQVNPVNYDDLYGFWDMMYIQVDDINKRFQQLNILKENGWKEIDTVKENRITVVKRKNKTKKLNNNQASSNLRSFLQAARKGQQYTHTPSNDDHTVQTSITKSKKPQQPITTPRLSSKKLLRISNTPNRSPGLTTLKIAMSVKQRIPLTPVNNNNN